VNETVSDFKHITLNGKQRDIPEGQRVSDLLADLELQERLVVVEHNKSSLPRNSYADVILEDGDVLEIVHFVGGG
jgi:thiamine biosynthesis protein ThiS